MFKKILIANRGEIAVRVIRSCEEMGIQTVAIYSEADRLAPHVLKATEAYCVGPAPSSESYLNTEKILSIIKEKKVDAVHPGYGFLSENCDFSRAVKDAGATWIGPSVEAITTMGDKMAARELAKSVNAPIIPGTTEPIEYFDDALAIAKDIGFPVLVKAAGGGGGKGMRIVHTESEFKDAVERAKSEAGKAFSDDRVYIEKFLEEPHHIEIQVFADNHGNVVSLGERECSIQRRYQKIIEETPSPFIDDELRKTLSETAIKITKACDYSGAGTVEFLIDKHKSFYFLEMNTRLQVEHPITETVTGIDLVREQILGAAGNKLSFSQHVINSSGHAIECRIYAEDGFNNFSPSTGTISDMIIPQGLGVRFDDGIRVHQEVTPYYDPLLGKLITWGSTRDIAIQRMIRSLKEFQISGIETSIPFCLMMVKHKAFSTGNYCTNTLNEISDELLKELKIHQKDRILSAGIAAALHSTNSQKKSTNSRVSEKSVSKWKQSGDKENLR
ncbi:MAG: acetyl-CoA carboxylase biotin carboxylase subunit [Candidatus Marinimicrobia bacterium]|nr:acetyl-CoA carboxylase biotin carboxylase subunit [Candidatus Neomarinimicrobiota bacterium]MBT6871049.1 acetyl-CoA carboxylase biotin carboxylase subunit [Candidatus Neomarinimicrobiota bacterium]